MPGFTLKADTFPEDAEGQALLGKVKQALKNLTGGPDRDGGFVKPPRKLDRDRDVLTEDYASVWRLCTLEYDPNERGASITGRSRIRIGPFFLAKRFTATDMEKVILHEYLHAVIDLEYKAAHHSHMEQIIKYNIGYRGPANPAEGMTD